MLSLVRAPFPFFGIGAIAFFIFGVMETVERVKLAENKKL